MEESPSGPPTPGLAHLQKNNRKSQNSFLADPAQQRALENHSLLFPQSRISGGQQCVQGRRGVRGREAGPAPAPKSLLHCTALSWEDDLWYPSDTNSSLGIWPPQEPKYEQSIEVLRFKTLNLIKLLDCAPSQTGCPGWSCFLAGLIELHSGVDSTLGWQRGHGDLPLHAV